MRTEAGPFRSDPQTQRQREIDDIVPADTQILKIISLGRALIFSQILCHLELAVQNLEYNM